VYYDQKAVVDFKRRTHFSGGRSAKERVKSGRKKLVGECAKNRGVAAFTKKKAAVSLKVQGQITTLRGGEKTTVRRLEELGGNQIATKRTPWTGLKKRGKVPRRLTSDNTAAKAVSMGGS